MIYFTSDLHLGHKNIIEYCNRPFSSVEEMDRVIIDNWRKTVGHNDQVFVLGDFAFHSVEKYAEQLKGSVFFLSGDHDKGIHKVSNVMGCKTMGNLHILQTDIMVHGRGVAITLCHYPMRSWYKSHYGNWHLFGHEHGTMEPYGKSFDVGVDANNFFPVSLDEVSERMNQLTPIVDYAEGK